MIQGYIREDLGDRSLAHMPTLHASIILEGLSKYKKMIVRQVDECVFWLIPVDSFPIRNVQEEEMGLFKLYDLRWDEPLRCYYYKYEEWL